MSYLDPLDKTDLGTVGIHEFITDTVGVPMTLTRVQNAAARKELRSVRMGYKNLFSRRMALEWLESLGVQVDWRQAKAAAKELAGSK